MTYMIDWDDWALEVLAWHDREWRMPDGSRVPIEVLISKLFEEGGELSGAIVKHIEGRTDEDWLANAEKEFGDVLIVLAVIADRIRQLQSTQVRLDQVPRRPTMESMRRARWATISERRGADYR